MSSGQIKGIGPKTAEKIYHAFGNDTLNILDEEPHRLLEVKGISKTKLQRIRDSYLASRGARDVVAFLAPHGVSPNRAVKLYREFGKDTLDILKNLSLIHISLPGCLCRYKYFSYSCEPKKNRWISTAFSCSSIS